MANVSNRREHWFIVYQPLALPFVIADKIVCINILISLSYQVTFILLLHWSYLSHRSQEKANLYMTSFCFIQPRATHFIFILFPSWRMILCCMKRTKAAKATYASYSIKQVSRKIAYLKKLLFEFKAHLPHTREKAKFSYISCMLIVHTKESKMMGQVPLNWYFLKFDCAGLKHKTFWLMSSYLSITFRISISSIVKLLTLLATWGE